MLDKTLGYILCCQSPALFLAALALLVAYLAGRKHRVKAFFRLLLCILCAAGAVALYFLGIYKEYFTIRDFFVIRAAGWIGLAIAAFFVLLALVRAFFAAADARRAQKEANRAENERLAQEAEAARAAEEVGSMETTLGFIKSLTSIKYAAFPIKCVLGKLCPPERAFIPRRRRGREIFTVHV